MGLGLPATSFPLAVICGLGAGALVGVVIYKGGNRTSLQIFLVVSTCFLYLVAAGLFSKGVWNFEQNAVSVELGYLRIRTDISSGLNSPVRELPKLELVQAHTISARLFGMST